MGDQGTSDVQDRVIALVRKHAPFPDRPINSETVIQIDLGIEGDDGYELIADFGAEFNCDLSAFDDRYFWDELSISWGMALLPLTPIAWAVMKVTGKGRKVDLTVRDLLNAALSGRWQNPDRSAKFPWERRASGRKH